MANAPQATCAFLETTAIVDLIFKDATTQRRVLGTIANYSKSYTSIYVRMECKRGVLQNLIYLHSKVSLLDNLDDVFLAISRLPHLQKNKLHTILEALEIFFRTSYTKVKFSTLMAQHGDITVDSYIKTGIESFLSNKISTFWDKFINSVNYVINSQDCFSNIARPLKANGSKVYYNSPSRCGHPDPKCSIRIFVNQNMEDFKSILSALKNINDPDSETLKRIKGLKEILRNHRREIIKTDCWSCSDAVLAVEAPPNAVVINNNRKHYDPICTAISKQSIGY